MPINPPGEKKNVSSNSNPQKVCKTCSLSWERSVISSLWMWDAIQNQHTSKDSRLGKLSIWDQATQSLKPVWNPRIQDYFNLGTLTWRCALISYSNIVFKNCHRVFSRHSPKPVLKIFHFLHEKITRRQWRCLKNLWGFMHGIIKSFLRTPFPTRRAWWTLGPPCPSGNQKTLLWQQLW